MGKSINLAITVLNSSGVWSVSMPWLFSGSSEVPQTPSLLSMLDTIKFRHSDIFKGQGFSILIQPGFTGCITPIDLSTVLDINEILKILLKFSVCFVHHGCI